MTKEERHLWYDFLCHYSVRFLRQKVIDSYIADFYCHKARLVIELDGSQHYEPDNQVRDSIRTLRIENRGLTVIRIPNNAVTHNFAGVCEYIDNLITTILEKESPLSASLTAPPLGKGGFRVRTCLTEESVWALKHYSATGS